MSWFGEDPGSRITEPVKRRLSEIYSVLFLIIVAHEAGVEDMYLKPTYFFG